MNLPTIKSLAIALAVAATSTFTTTTTMAQSSNPTDNLAVGQAFLKENATKPGVHTTPSGLQYKVITEGHGKSPKATDTESLFTTAERPSMAPSSTAPTSVMSPSHSLSMVSFPGGPRGFS